ncbi:hypothetical protein DOJK_01711 [Patescibacteria group bacterium]|nr:hypothetical protein [Candidatus Dojkabacteria bacterium]CAG1022496.1 hypothetical protein DOJK_01711 [Patescibacteria group bacterium]
MKKYLIYSITTFAISVSLMVLPVLAQDRPGGLINSTTSCVNCNIDDELALGEIRIPIFASFIDFDTNNASILSWLSFVGALATIGLVVFWVFLLVKAGVKGLQSQGNAENLAVAFKQVQSVLLGAAITLFFPVVLSVVGLLLGVGTIFSWPKMFQFCSDTTNYEFYYQALLDKTQNTDAAAAEAACQPLGN